MLCPTRGLVLSKINYGDTSLIVRIFTEKFGRQTYLLKGVRSAKGKNKTSFLQPGNLLDLIVYKRENKNLQAIREFRFVVPWQSIPFDVRKSAITLFILEVFDKATPETDTPEELYAFIEKNLIILDSEEKAHPLFPVWFLLQFSEILGFFPENNFHPVQRTFFDFKEGIFVSEKSCSKEGVGLPVAKWLSATISQIANREEPRNLLQNRRERMLLLEQLLLFYQYHLPGLQSIRSVKVLQTVFEEEGIQ